MLVDTLNIKLDIEAIKKKLTNQDKSIELVFSYLDELIEKQENPKPRKQIGFKINHKEWFWFEFYQKTPNLALKYISHEWNNKLVEKTSAWTILKIW